jgi:tetratricopeptide (TPR) repeat protein
MIAISYRREDSLPIAGRLYDRLQAEFGKGNVFMDFDSIPYGVDFREHIKHMIDRSKVLIAIIGPDWSGKRRQRARRIDDPADFVRLEIAYALQRGIPLIPVLINDTPMPKAPDLPSDIEALAFRNAVTLHVGIDFHHHADRLVGGINRLIMEAAKSAPIRKDVARPRAPTIDAPFTGGLFQEPSPSAPPKPPSEKTAPPSQTTHVFEHPKSALESPPGRSQKPSSLEPSKLGPERPRVETSRSTEGTTSLVQRAKISASRKKVGWLARLQQRDFINPAVLARLKTSIGRFQHQNKIIIFVGGFLATLVAVGTWYLALHVPNQRTYKTNPEQSPETRPSPSPEISTGPSKSSTVDELLETANAFRDRGDITNAFAYLQAANLRDPKNTNVLMEMAKLYESSRSFAKATEMWRRIREIGPLSGPVYDLAESKLRAPSKSSVTGQQSTSDVQSTKESSAPSAPANQSLTRNSRTWQAWISEFVKQFISTNQLQDVDANVAFYAANVDYFDDHQKDQAYIRNDVEKYNERWPIRRDSIEGDIQIHEKITDKEYAASFKLNFYAESTPRNEWSEGQFAIDLDISIVDEVPKISGIKEEVLRQQKGTTQGNAPNTAATSPSPAAEVQRNSFGIIEGDYNCQFRLHPKTKHVGDKFGGRKDVAVITYGSKFVIKGTRFSHFFSLHQEPTAAGAGTWAVERYTIRADGNIFTNSPGVFILKPDRFEVVEKFPKSLADSSTSIARDHQRLPYTRWIVRYEETRMVQTSDGETWNLENKLP